MSVPNLLSTLCFSSAEYRIAVVWYDLVWCCCVALLLVRCIWELTKTPQGTGVFRGFRTGAVEFSMKTNNTEEFALQRWGVPAEELHRFSKQESKKNKLDLLKGKSALRLP